MQSPVSGLHHITAIADNAQRNYTFYTQVLGLRFVKKTVNFDDPFTYHFYYGNEQGTPGTILTFFPWEGIGPGAQGVGLTTEIGYAVPAGSLDFWRQRLQEAGVAVLAEAERFGETVLSFQDPDGIPLSLIVPRIADTRTPWSAAGIGAAEATRGFHQVTLSLRDLDPTALVLTEALGYRSQGQEGNRFRFVSEATTAAGIVDIVVTPDARPGRNAAGTIHHIAFRVPNDDAQMALREKILTMGLQITPQIDRTYFHSLYFREPGGVLFEIATDNPGFAVDESVANLGSALMLPPQYEAHRKAIEARLPALR